MALSSWTLFIVLRWNFECRAFEPRRREWFVFAYRSFVYIVNWSVSGIFPRCLCLPDLIGGEIVTLIGLSSPPVWVTEDVTDDFLLKFFSSSTSQFSLLVLFRSVENQDVGQIAITSRNSAANSNSNTFKIALLIHVFKQYISRKIILTKHSSSSILIYF